jgi:hypothetical protein
MQTATKEIPEHKRKIATYEYILCYLKNALKIKGLNSFTTRVDILLQWAGYEDRQTILKGPELVRSSVAIRIRDPVPF